jgi:ADP-ribose pyrophosphatase
VRSRKRARARGWYTRARGTAMAESPPDPSDAPPVRRRVLTGARFNVDRLVLRGRDGREVERELVVHPGSVVIVPVLDDGQIVLIRNERPSVGRALWELPAGTLEQGEDPSACAARELEEETGYRAARVERLTAFFACPGTSTERMHAFVATGLSLVGQKLEPTEQIRPEPRALERVVEMVRDGEIEDAKTIAAVLFYRAFR